jgi:DNA-binding CsgD family transcriptional regulator
MLSLARRAAREVEQRLLGDIAGADRLAAQRFLEARRRLKGPIVFVSDRAIMVNPAADHLVTAADRSVLWEHAKALLAGAGTRTSQVMLTNGNSVSISCEPVVDGGTLVGGVLRLVPAAEATAGPPEVVPVGGGWSDMTATEQSVARLVGEGLTNREVGELLFMSRYTVDTHLRSIFRKLAVTSRVELARISTGQRPA